MSDGRSRLGRRGLLGAVAASTATIAGCMGDPEYDVADVDREPLGDDDPLSFAVDVHDPGIRIDSPAAFTLSVANETDETLELVSRGVRPFGVLRLRGERDDAPGEPWIRLRSDAYEASEYVDARPNGMSVSGEVLVTTLEAGASASFGYEIRGEDVPQGDGTYELEGQWVHDVATYRRPGTADDGASDDPETDGEEGASGGDEEGASGGDEEGASGDEADTGDEDDAGVADPEDDEGSVLEGTGVSPDIQFRIETRNRLPFR